MIGLGIRMEMGIKIGILLELGVRIERCSLRDWDGNRLKLEGIRSRLRLELRGFRSCDIHWGYTLGVWIS